MAAREVAELSLGLGWTMNEVREHTWTDLDAILEIKKEQARRERMRASAKKVGG